MQQFIKYNHFQHRKNVKGAEN
uniref:Uncharacterized protein n=1 Tax=Rhizophora mucronata TaxID=61149 RepID=A0A2P2PH89_RHIMU